MQNEFEECLKILQLFWKIGSSVLREKEVEQLAFLNCPKLIVDATAAPRYIRRSYLLQGRSGQLSICNQKGCEPGDRSFAW